MKTQLVLAVGLGAAVLFTIPLVKAVTPIHTGSSRVALLKVKRAEHPELPPGALAPDFLKVSPESIQEAIKLSRGMDHDGVGLNGEFLDMKTERSWPADPAVAVSPLLPPGQRSVVDLPPEKQPSLAEQLGINDVDKSVNTSVAKTK